MYIGNIVIDVEIVDGLVQFLEIIYKLAVRWNGVEGKHVSGTNWSQNSHHVVVQRISVVCIVPVIDLRTLFLPVELSHLVIGSSSELGMKS